MSRQLISSDFTGIPPPQQHCCKESQEGHKDLTSASCHCHQYFAPHLHPLSTRALLCSISRSPGRDFRTEWDSSNTSPCSQALPLFSPCSSPQRSLLTGLPEHSVHHEDIVWSWLQKSLHLSLLWGHFLNPIPQQSLRGDRSLWYTQKCKPERSGILNDKLTHLPKKQRHWFSIVSKAGTLISSLQYLLYVQAYGKKKNQNSHWRLLLLNQV